MINQIGYNARKDDELLRYIRREGLGVRALANVYLLSRPAARAFHAGRIRDTECIWSQAYERLKAYG